MNTNSKIYIAGHKGLVGSAILKSLKEKGYHNFVVRTHDELDLIDTVAVRQFFQEEQPEYGFLAAAKVGGIVANNRYRAEFMYENLMIQNNVIHQSYLGGVKKLLFLGSTCVYPKNAPQPMSEDCLLTSELEYTNEPYAIAKIAGIKMCESYNIQFGTNFISVMPTNLYGPNDNFDLEKSHVLPALIRKIHLGMALETNNWKAIREDLNNQPIAGINGDATEQEILNILSRHGVKQLKIQNLELKTIIEIWGTGQPRREFLWSEEMADASVFIMENIDFNDCISDKKEIKNTHINIGTGEDISIKELAFLIKNVVGYEGGFNFDHSKPDGTLRKLTDVSKLSALGWKHRIKIEEGVQKMYTWYCSLNRE